MRALDADTLVAADRIRQLNGESASGVAMVSCTDSPPVAFGGIENLRIKKIWRPTVTQTQETVRSWVAERLAETALASLKSLLEK